MRREVINRHFDAFPFLQLSENVDQQLEVEGVGVVEVILVLGCQLLLLWIQHLPHRHNVHSLFGAARRFWAPHEEANVVLQLNKLGSGGCSVKPPGDHQGGAAPPVGLYQAADIKKILVPCRRSPWRAEPPRERPTLR